MRLFSGPSEDFIDEAKKNRIPDILAEAYRSYYGRSPSTSEYHSWQNSLVRIKDVFVDAGLFDNGVILEYQLPYYSGRLDCMVTGHDTNGHDAAVVVELKQWDKVSASDCERTVTTWIGQRAREVPHPSAQVLRYRQYLVDRHTAFQGTTAVRLDACAYLHNYRRTRNDPLYDSKFSEILQVAPAFSSEQFDDIVRYSQSCVGRGNGVGLLSRIEGARIHPSRRLLEHVSGVIRSEPIFTLLDNQITVYERVRTSAKHSLHDKRKVAVIVHGGPGTGKSLLAINLMADLLNGKDGTSCEAHYVTGSKAFTRTLRKIVGQRGSEQFTWTNDYADSPPDSVPVLLIDEAHRIRKVTTNRFAPRPNQPKVPQVEELLRAGRVCVFFIDDLQTVSPTDSGSVASIKDACERLGIKVFEYDLEGQFRCGGSEDFVRWVDQTLGLRAAEIDVTPTSKDFDFQIFDTPQELETAIRERVKEGFTGRLTAGFCWPWSEARKDGTLADDVVIGEYRRPWNAREEATGLAKGVPKAPLWAYEAGGLGQIGCVYTAQGFEFDYAGVIFGPDLQYDEIRHQWVGHPELSRDRSVARSGEAFGGLVKRAYRVLLTRGLRGCYVYFTEPGTRRYFERCSRKS